MSAVDRPTDGPDTELAAAIGFLARNEGLLIEMENSPAGRAAATIVRAVLARPTAVQPRPADDPLRLAVGRYVDHGPAGPWKSQLNEALIQDARPAPQLRNSARAVDLDRPVRREGHDLAPAVQADGHDLCEGQLDPDDAAPRSAVVDLGEQRDCNGRDDGRGVHESTVAVQPHDEQPDTAAMFAELQRWLVDRKARCDDAGTADTLSAVYGDVLDKLDEIVRGAARSRVARPAAGRDLTAPKHLLVGDRVETADGARATVTGSAPRGPRGEPAVNLAWDGDAGGPAYEHDLLRVPGGSGGRDLTAKDLRDALPAHTPARVLAVLPHIVWRLSRIVRPAVARTDEPTDVAGAERSANGSAPGVGASASTDGPPPVDERAILTDVVQRLRQLSTICGNDEQVTALADRVVAHRDRVAAPADDTAAPDGPTADEAVASAARIVEAWAHLRMDTPEDQAMHDELVRVSRATIAAYVRTRPWSSAGQPVRDSQPD